MVLEKYDFMPNTFLITQARSLTTDFLLPLQQTKVGLFVNLDLVHRSTDWYFYSRPFNNLSWIAVVMVLISIAIWNYFLKNDTFENSRSLLIFTGWLFYTIVFAYYSGAQTMFLSVSQNLDIKNSKDVLKSSKWSLIVVRDYDAFVDTYARSGCKLFQKLRLDINKDKYPYFMESLEVFDYLT